MPLSLYDATVPVFERALKALSGLLDKAEAHAAETGADLKTYLDARLAPDMHPLVRQIQIAADGAKGGAARLAGVEAPKFEDTETTIPELKARIAKTLDYLATVRPDEINGSEDRIIEFRFPGGGFDLTAWNFVTDFALPNFFFHVTTAYALLRAQGVPIGKRDYLAGMRQL